MGNETWARVTELFEAARQLPRADRDAWVRAQEVDEVVRREVLTLLGTYDDAPDFLEQPADRNAAATALREGLSKPLEDRRLGSYRLRKEIGRGGMGVVYDGYRDDEAFSRRVAIKVLPLGMSGSAFAGRFNHERRILAALDHPGIARLLDAGTTDEGTPYFVMEYVDGEPIDAWASSHGLDALGRVGLVLDVCDAVAYAHQNLVVHRDIKAANILVGADGKPKLLDFGIAKILSDQAELGGALTRPGQHVFTPGYASPEQIRGEAVTTATDVYSLGVLLYVLLAGQPPFAVDGLPTFEAMRVVCETEPVAPSRTAAAALRRTLSGDLDNIILKALRKEPKLRYGSVWGLADDLRAWVDGRTVSATPASAWYRARKAVGRHKAAAVATVAIVLAVAGGAAATAWQAHVARIERDKAESRFRQVRQFSRSLLFELHDSIRQLPGSTASRQLLLARAVEFLDGLARDAGSDTALKLELAEGYRRLGQVQGSDFSENVGNVEGAVASFEKASRLAEDVLASDPRSVQAAIVLTGALDNLADADLGQGALPAAERADRRHREVTERMARDHPRDPKALASVASSYANLAFFRGQRNDLAGAKALYARAISLFESLPAARSDAALIARHGFALKRLGAILLKEGQLDEAERRYRAALALDEQNLASHPNDPSARYDLTFALTDLGLIARKRGDLAGARDFYTRALTIRMAALEADPKNVRAVIGVANVHVYLWTVNREQGRLDEGRGHAEEAVRLRQRLNEVRKPAPGDRIALAWVQTYLAEALLDEAGKTPAAGQRASLLREAGAWLARAEPVARQFSAGQAISDPALLAEIERELARARNLGR
jgi:non-specific serine/threonine protein kinase/serine/threonine-protein kinase